MKRVPMRVKQYDIFPLDRGVHTQYHPAHPPCHNYPGHRAFVEVFQNGKTWKVRTKSANRVGCTQAHYEALIKWAETHRPEWIEALNKRTHVLMHGIFNESRDAWFLYPRERLDPFAIREAGEEQNAR